MCAAEGGLKVSPMSDYWMEHPCLVAWFDELEDAVTTAMALPLEQRAAVKALAAPRTDTWVMLAENAESRDHLRALLSEAQHYVRVPVAKDCRILVWRADFIDEEDAFDLENGFSEIDVEYLEEGSAAALRAELLSDAEDYAAGAESGWFYTKNEEDTDEPS